MVVRKYLLTIEDVCLIFDISRVTLWRLQKNKNFPKSIKGISSKVQFLAVEVEEYFTDLLTFNGKERFSAILKEGNDE